MHVQRGLQYFICVCVCVCLSVTSLIAAPLTYTYKVRYEAKGNAIEGLDLWISLKILCSNVMALFAYYNEL